MITESLYQDYLSALLTGNRQSATRTVDGLLQANVGIEDIYVNLMQRALYEIGDLWETNQISVAVEHLATAISESVLQTVYPRIFATPRSGKKAVIACVINEYHQLGARMAADIFELNGWDAHFLGANTPGEDLLQLIDDVTPRLLGLSLAMDHNLPALLSLLETIENRFPDLSVFVGGQAFRRAGDDTLQGRGNVRYIESLHELQLAISG